MTQQSVTSEDVFESLDIGEVLDELETRFGNKLEAFSELQRLALASVCTEGYVTHGQLKSMSVEHSRDITMGLAALVREGIFESAGVAKGTYYYFAGKPPQSLHVFDDVATFGSLFPSVLSPASVSSVPLPGGSVPLTSVPLPANPVPLLPDMMDTLKRIAEPIRAKKKASQDEVRIVIARVCAPDYMPLKVLAQLLGRSPEYLRIKRLNEMVASGELSERFPNTPSHPQQGYKAAKRQIT